jgi:cation transport protein ChaC
MDAPIGPESLAALRRIRDSRPPGDLWVFAYASLIWRPECEHHETRHALVRGWHRSLCMKSTVNRGTPERHGLVFALDVGGACRGMALRISQACADVELQRLWHREMLNAVYTPRWVRCATPQGDIVALAFTLRRSHPSYLGRLGDDEVLRIFRHSRGRYGTTWDYVRQTHEALQKIGIHDAPLARLVRLGERAGL